MRVLLDSSWMRFGPPGSRSDDWEAGSPPTQEQQSYSWFDQEESRRSDLELYIVLPLISILLLVLLVGLIYCRRFHKLSLAKVIALNLQDTESGAEFLASLTRNAERHTSTSSDGSEGVFVMVYLAPPFEGTLSKITRAASLSSSKDVDLIKMEVLEAELGSVVKSVKSV